MTTRLKEARGVAAVKMQDDRPTAAPDHEGNSDVSEQRAPVVRGLDDGHVERVVPQRAINRKHIARPLDELLEERFACPLLPPRMRHNRAVERAEGSDEM